MPSNSSPSIRRKRTVESFKIRAQQTTIFSKMPRMKSDRVLSMLLKSAADDE